MRRPSTSSDGSATLSDTTTACSYVKDDSASIITTSTSATANTVAAEKAQAQRGAGCHRGLRQKARDVIHDMGHPPTRRQDAKDGIETKNHDVDLSMIGTRLGPGKI